MYCFMRRAWLLIIKLCACLWWTLTSLSVTEFIVDSSHLVRSRLNEMTSLWYKFTRRLHTLCFSVFFACAFIVWTVICNLLSPFNDRDRGIIASVLGGIFGGVLGGGLSGGSVALEECHLLMESDSNFTHRIVKIQGVRLYYVEAGRQLVNTEKHVQRGSKQEKRLMLFLHGFAETSIAWKQQLEHFGAHMHVVAVDLPGCGRSERIKDSSSYRPRNAASLVLNFIRHLGAEGQCILVASDSAALFSWQLIQMAPKCCTHYVAVSQPLPHITLTTLNRSFNHKWKRWLLYLYQLPWLPEYLVSHGYLRLLQREYGALFEAKSDASATNLMYYQIMFDNHDDWFGPISSYRSLFDQDYHDVPEYRSIETPCLLLFGENDPLTSAHNRHASLKYLCSGAVEIIEDSTNHLSQSSPEEFNRLIQQFASVKMCEKRRCSCSSDEAVADRSESVEMNLTPVTPRWPGLGTVVYKQVLRGMQTVRTRMDSLK